MDARQQMTFIKVLLQEQHLGEPRVLVFNAPNGEAAAAVVAVHDRTPAGEVAVTGVSTANRTTPIAAGAACVVERTSVAMAVARSRKLEFGAGGGGSIGDAGRRHQCGQFGISRHAEPVRAGVVGARHALPQEVVLRASPIIRASSGYYEQSMARSIRATQRAGCAVLHRPGRAACPGDQFVPVGVPPPLEVAAVGVVVVVGSGLPIQAETGTAHVGVVGTQVVAEPGVPVLACYGEVEEVVLVAAGVAVVILPELLVGDARNVAHLVGGGVARIVVGVGERAKQIAQVVAAYPGVDVQLYGIERAAHGLDGGGDVCAAAGVRLRSPREVKLAADAILGGCRRDGDGGAVCGQGAAGGSRRGNLHRHPGGGDCALVIY
ncbi:MAG: hypothetical protein H6Q14_2106 [Bacteroidetes bacterium]|nr:hypothetical protein [Bacteroidota bacterium]